MFEKLKHYLNIQKLGALIFIGGFLASSMLLYFVTSPKISKEIQMIQTRLIENEFNFYEKIFKQEIKGWVEEAQLLGAVPDVLNNIIRPDGKKGLATYLDSIKFGDDLKAIKIFDILHDVIYEDGYAIPNDNVTILQLVKEMLKSNEPFDFVIINSPEPLLVISVPVFYVDTIEGVIIAAYQMPWEELIDAAIYFDRKVSLQGPGGVLMSLNTSMHDEFFQTKSLHFSKETIGGLIFDYDYYYTVDGLLNKIVFDLYSVIFVSLFVIYLFLYYLGRHFVFNPFQALQSALEENKLNTEIINHAIDSVIVTDGQMLDDPGGPKIEYVNHSFEKMTGYSRAELLGKTPRILQGDETETEELLRIKDALKSCSPVTAEIVNYGKSGKKYWVDCSIVPIRLTDGRLKFASFQRDVTDRKLQEEKLEKFANVMELKNIELFQASSELKKSEEFSDSVIQNMLNALLVFDARGVIVRANQGAENCFGISVENLLGKSVESIFPAFDMYTVDDYIGRGSAQAHTADIRTASNAIVHVLYLVGKMEIDNEYLYILSLLDISKQKEAEDASMSKSLFISSVSHELRTPLHAIISYSKFGVKDIQNNKLERILDNFSTIELSAKRLLKLVNEILDFTKFESGSIDLSFDSIDLSVLFHDVFKELAPLLIQKKIQHHVTGDAGLICDADTDRLTQVAVNVLSNAIKHTPTEGAIVVSLAREEQTILIKIADSGPGVEVHQLKTIFDLFTQTENGQNKGGTGLGLTIANKIIEAHKGKIWAENGKPNGLIVCIRLPVEQPKH